MMGRAQGVVVIFILLAVLALVLGELVKSFLPLVIILAVMLGVYKFIFRGGW